MTQGHLIKALLIFNRKTGTPFIYYVPDKNFNTEPGLNFFLLSFKKSSSLPIGIVKKINFFCKHSSRVLHMANLSTIFSFF